MSDDIEIIEGTEDLNLRHLFPPLYAQPVMEVGFVSSQLPEKFLPAAVHSGHAAAPMGPTYSHGGSAFGHRADILLVRAGMSAETPLPVLADWYEERGDAREAAFLRAWHALREAWEAMQ